MKPGAFAIFTWGLFMVLSQTSQGFWSPGHIVLERYQGGEFDQLKPLFQQGKPFAISTMGTRGPKCSSLDFKFNTEKKRWRCTFAMEINRAAGLKADHPADFSEGWQNPPAERDPATSGKLERQAEFLSKVTEAGLTYKKVSYTFAVQDHPEKWVSTLYCIELELGPDESEKAGALVDAYIKASGQSGVLSIDLFSPVE
jgi:hypothetical protein